MKIIVTSKIQSVCPDFVGAAVEAWVQNTPYCPELWDEINALCQEYRSRFTTVSIKEMAAIEATRRVYRACGKDPSRYRPAAEALIRRVVQGKELYQIDTLVDLINLASMKYGYSIGGFDADKFVGDTLTLGVGEAGEPYEGIGRGMLNIEGLPVYRDQKGGVGTPTSDNERTKIDITTTHVLILVNGYDGNKETVGDNAEFLKSLLERYAAASDVTIQTY
ncbi:MAG: phenylalanine--tRNA ligase beta subunit-related protein [Prevotellaceae bacterium]|nr:phenylalanine--tRNA ligase beta subunit-related protein [Prevotellaceae bacterium]